MKFSTIHPVRGSSYYHHFIARIIVIMSTVFMVVSSACAWQISNQSRMQIGIISFLYMVDGGYDPDLNGNEEIENAVIFSGLEEEMDHHGIGNYSLRYEKVVAGELDYLGTTDFIDEEMNGIFENYDLIVWGLVTPKTWPHSYDLRLILFYSAEPAYQVHLKIKQKKIIAWNNKKCYLPEKAIALIPSVMAFKITHASVGSEENIEDVNQLISKRLAMYGSNFPLSIEQDLLSWYPRDDYAADARVGWINYEFENGSKDKLKMDQDTYEKLGRYLETDKSFNWYLSQDGLLLPEIAIKVAGAEVQMAPRDMDEYYEEALDRDRYTIGILPIENNSGASEHDWIGFGLEYIMAGKFSHIDAYQLIDQELAVKYMESDSATFELNGEALALDYGIRGEYTVIDGDLDVRLELVRPWNRIRMASERYLIDYDDLFDITDDAAQKFIRSADLLLSTNEDRLFNRRLTYSVKAFRNFCLGYIENSKKTSDKQVVLNYFKQAIAEDAQFWEAYYNLGTTYFNMEEYDLAFQQFQTIIDASPSFEMAYLGRGLTLLQQNKFEQAKTDFKRFLDYKPYDFRSHYYLGFVSNRLQRYNEAKKFLVKALELNPNYSRIYLELGNAYFSINRYRSAIDYYERTIKMDPEQLDARARLGESYYRMHNFKGAIEQFDIVLAVNPRDDVASFMKGVAIYKQALLDEYIDAFLEMYGWERPDRKAIPASEVDKERQRIYRQMVKWFAIAAGARDNFYEATFNLALTFQELGVADSALHYYKKTIQIRPDLSKAHVVLAKFYETQDDYDLALEEYKKVVRLDPRYFIFYPNLGPMYDDLDIIEVVSSELEDEIRQDAENIHSRLSLANIYYAQGYMGKAAGLYRKVLAIEPQNTKSKAMLTRIENGETVY